MSAEAKKVTAMLALVLLVFTIFISVTHSHDNCAFDNCPICLQIHNFSDILKIVTSFIGILNIALLLILAGMIYFDVFLNKFNADTLIDKKIRLNN